MKSDITPERIILVLHPGKGRGEAMWYPDGGPVSGREGWPIQEYIRRDLFDAANAKAEMYRAEALEMADEIDANYEKGHLQNAK